MQALQPVSKARLIAVCFVAWATPATLKHVVWRPRILRVHSVRVLAYYVYNEPSTLANVTLGSGDIAAGYVDITPVTAMAATTYSGTTAINAGILISSGRIKATITVTERVQLLKTGIIKVYWDKTPDTQSEDLAGVDQDTLWRGQQQVQRRSHERASWREAVSRTRASSRVPVMYSERSCQSSHSPSRIARQPARVSASATECPDMPVKASVRSISFWDFQLVAPVRVGRGATLAAGTTLTRDAPPGQLTLSRVRQESKPHWQRPVKKPK